LAISARALRNCFNCSAVSSMVDRFDLGHVIY
jgi:hypothetical protein